MSHLYDHGLPFGKQLAASLDQQRQRVVDGFASLIIIDGGVGQGKTTLAVECADYLHGKPIKFEEQLAMGGEQFVGLLRVSSDKKMVVLVYDESGDFTGRGAITRFNRMINRIFDTYRAFKVVVIMALPLFTVLDQEIFHKGLVRFLVNCYGRKPGKYGNYRVYDAGKALYIRSRMEKLIIKRQAYAFEQPNYFGHFLDLPPERCATLDKFSTGGKRDEAIKAEVSLEGLLDYGGVARKLQRSVIWVRHRVGKLKIKHYRIINRKKYFGPEVVSRLEEELDGK